MTGDRLLPIGEFAKAARLTIKALRHYDAEGVLRPARVDRVTGYRYYLRTQLADALLLSLLRTAGVSLPAVREALADRDALADVLRGERDRLAREAARANGALAVVQRILQERGLPAPAVDIVEEPDRAMLWHAGWVEAANLELEVTQLIRELLEQAEAAGIATQGPVTGTYPVILDDRLEVRVGIEVMDGDGHTARVSVVPGGTFARVTHVGGYEELPLAYHAVLEWLHARALPAEGPFLERYLAAPGEVGPGELVTEVLHPAPGARRR